MALFDVSRCRCVERVLPMVLLRLTPVLSHSVPCTLPVLLYPDCPGFAFCPFLYNIRNTNIHAPGGIKTRNPS